MMRSTCVAADRVVVGRVDHRFELEEGAEAVDGVEVHAHVVDEQHLAPLAYDHQDALGTGMGPHRAPSGVIV